MADNSLPTGIYTLPPLILSGDVSQSYWPWSGYIPSTTIQPKPTSPGEIPDTPMFSASTNELDKYRVLFLVVGVIIGVMLFGRK